MQLEREWARGAEGKLCRLFVRWCEARLSEAGVVNLSQVNARSEILAWREIIVEMLGSKDTLWPIFVGEHAFTQNQLISDYFPAPKILYKKFQTPV